MEKKKKKVKSVMPRKARCIVCEQVFQPNKYAYKQKICNNIECKKAYRKEYYKQWMAENPEYLKTWVKNHAEERKEYMKTWLKEHPNYRKEWEEKNRERRRKYMCEYMRRYRNKD